MARIVVAEDHIHIRHVLVMWLGRHGHEAVEAANGRLALEALRAVGADVLITDVNMPEMDGLELTRAAFDACPTLRGIFVVTSRCDQREIIEQLHDPRIRVFPKPFSPSQLVKQVASLMSAVATGTGAGP